MMPWRALAVVVLPPLVALGLGVGVWLAADRAEAAAGVVQERLALALARPAPDANAEAAALLVPGQTAGLAASALQALALERVQSGGLQVTQVEPGAAEAGTPLVRLHLVLRVSGSEAALVQGLVALEGAVPLIFVDKLDVQGSGAEDGVLSASLALSAWAGQVQP